MKRLISIAIILTSLVSCNELFDYSPYTLSFDNDELALNEKNASLLMSKQLELINKDTIFIAFTGDTHRFYTEWEAFVEKVNLLPEVDFVIHTGDFTDFGLPRQYKWGARIMSSLNVPYFVTVGNHDLVAAGHQSFLEMFGSLDFSFIAGNTKVILINNNSREFAYSGNVPNLNWLEAELADDESFENVIIVGHLPILDNDFDINLKEGFVDLLNSHSSILGFFHGHLHGFDNYMLEDCTVPMINPWGVEHRKLTILKIHNNGVDIENHNF